VRENWSMTAKNNFIQPIIPEYYGYYDYWPMIMGKKLFEWVLEFDGEWNSCCSRKSGTYWNTTKIKYRPEAKRLEGQELFILDHWSNYYG